MACGNDKKDEGCIGSRIKKLFSSDCGCGCCGTRIVPKGKKEEPEAGDE
ncbi:hypothetical protein [Methanoculleus sp. 7T]|jgi:hypothetical protein|nr:hypothetical protein [Methanoculleus sp. 7T]MCK8518514.1 hypothetical protein [Methanoculleus sp. 7T]